jgi:hypothetical protein
MIRLFGALLFLAVSASASAQDYSYKVVYSGGSLASVRSGADATLYVDPTVVRIVVDHLNVVSIPSNTITQVAFGDEVPHTLGSLITLGKQKKHLVGFTWSYYTQRGGLAIQCTASEYEGILLALQGVSGKQATNISGVPAKAGDAQVAANAHP